MVNSSDGFEISEKDLKLRGPGDFFGTKQHGIPDFKIANLYKDIDIMKISQEAARQVYINDCQLEKNENNPLKDKIKKSLNFFNNSL